MYYACLEKKLVIGNIDGGRQLGVVTDPSFCTKKFKNRAL
jgi:hypothetical protein